MAERFKNAPVSSNWWFEASWRKQGEWKSARTKEFVCGSAREYQSTLTLGIEGGLKLQGPD